MPGKGFVFTIDMPLAAEDVNVLQSISRRGGGEDCDGVRAIEVTSRSGKRVPRLHVPSEDVLYLAQRISSERDSAS